MDGGAGERLGSTENHVNLSACGNVGGKGRVVGGDRVDGVGGVSRKGVMGKIRLENSRKIWGTLCSTTSAAILNVVKRTTSESLVLIVSQSKESTK